MAIMSAIQINDNHIYAYNEDEDRILDEKGFLYKYSEKYVTIIDGNEIRIYNSDGNLHHVLPNKISL